ncbi:hypothetical protein ACFXDI_17695, partial [Streptomyces mirabilis]
EAQVNGFRGAPEIRRVIDDAVRAAHGGERYRPVLNSMGAAHIVQGWFTLDKDITTDEDGGITVAPATAEALAQVVDQFSAALGSAPLLAAAG